MTDDEARNTHGVHQDEAIRARREKRATDRVLVDERALAGRRLDALLPFDPSAEPRESDFKGCYW